MLVLMMFVTGCKNTPVNNVCLWLKPITVTEKERTKLLTEETLRQIYNLNEEFEARCG